MTKKSIMPENLKVPSGPFSWGVKAGNFVFLSGMVAIDINGVLIGKGDVKLQAKQILENIKAALQSIGLSPRNIIKLATFMRDIKEYGKFNEARKEFFDENGIKEDYPASTAVQGNLIRDDFLIEIEVIAYAE